MAEDSATNESRRLEDIINELDKTSPSPDVRAMYVLRELQGLDAVLTEWDIICFCVEYLGMVASQSFPILMSNSKALAKIVYMIHYQSEENEFRESIVKPMPRNGKQSNSEGNVSESNIIK